MATIDWKDFAALIFHVKTEFGSKMIITTTSLKPSLLLLRDGRFSALLRVAAKSFYNSRILLPGLLD